MDSARVLDAELLRPATVVATIFMFNLRIFPLAKNAVSHLRAESIQQAVARQIHRSRHLISMTNLVMPY